MTEDLSMVGLSFVVGLNGPKLSAEEHVLLEQLRPAGIILFAKNIAQNEPDNWIPKLLELIASAKAAAGRSEFIISVDHEGGRVHRFPEPVTHFPHAFAWRENSFQVGRAMGRELRALSFNLNFSPVLDIHCEPLNPVIGARAFGVDAESAAKFALEFAAGMEAEGVLSCGKHFPGHGATTTDSHHVLPVLNADRALLDVRELVPFVRYIEAGYRMIMTAHVHYPLLETRWPATLSPAIVSELLRKALGFRGVVITDDLEMAALKTLSPGERALHALGAGCDLLLEGYPRETPALRTAVEMARAIVRAVDARVFAEDRLVASHLRVMRLLDHLGELQSREQPDLLLARIGCPEHQQICSQVTRV